jgi:hypothetical protein
MPDFVSWIKKSQRKASKHKMVFSISKEDLTEELKDFPATQYDLADFFEDEF